MPPLLVVTWQEAVAKWARRPIDLGSGNRFVPLVLGPSGVPEVTEEAAARIDPELAVLSAMAHGRDADPGKALRIAAAAIAASVGLDAERSTLYFDLVETSLSRAARKALRSMDPANYEYQSKFARRYFNQGMTKGKAEGRAEVLLKLLSLRFGPLPAEVRTRLLAATEADLDCYAERVLTAASIDAVFAPA